MRIGKWHAVHRNTLRGFFTLELDSGLVIHDCALHESHGKRWFSFPSRPMVENGELLRDGSKVRYAPVVECERSRLDLLQAKIMELLEGK